MIGSRDARYAVAKKETANIKAVSLLGTPHV
jgi:hypothetical protein